MSIITENMDYTDLLFPIYLTSSENGFIFLFITTKTVVDRAKEHNYLFPMNYSLFMFQMGIWDISIPLFFRYGYRVFRGENYEPKLDAQGN